MIIRDTVHTNTFSTNDVLVENRGEVFYYLPCYLRFKLKHFVSIELAAQEAVINGDLIISFYYGKLSSFLVEALKSSVTIHFNRNESIRLCKSRDIGMKQEQQSQVISFTLRRDFKTAVQSSYFVWPFEMIKLILIVTLRSLTTDNPLNFGKPVLMRFNCMDHQRREVKFSYNRKVSIGSYCLAPQKIAVFYSRQPQLDLNEYQFTQQVEEQLISLSSERDGGESLQTVNDHIEQPKLNQNIVLGYFQYGHFIIGVYHYPFTTLFGLLLPMWSLALYNLMIYFQGADMSMRISNSVFIDLSLLDYIPTIRSQLPDTPNLLLIQVLLYSLAVTFHLTIIDSYMVYQDSNYQMDWKNNRLFQVSLAVFLLTVLIVLLLTLIHKLWWQKTYVSQQIKGKMNHEQVSFERREWSNKQSDEYFNRFISVHPLQ